MALQVGKDVLGLAKQTAKGTIAANPTFLHGLAGGGIKVEISQESDELTSAYLAPAGAYRDAVENGADYTTRAWQKAVGAYLIAALGNVATSGSGPYTHTITLAAGALAYWTVFVKKGDGTITAVKDCKLDELEISWEENKPLELAAKWAGTVFSFPATFVGTVDESDTTNYFVPVGGTFKYDVDSATPVVASVKSGKIAIKRGAEPQMFSGAIEAGDVYEGAAEVSCQFNVIPDDLTLWRTIVTGAAAGTTIGTTPLYGSFEHTFTKGADSLKLASSYVAFLADLPEADPAGGAAEMELSGLCYRGGTATPLTATLINTQVSY